MGFALLRLGGEFRMGFALLRFLQREVCFWLQRRRVGNVWDDARRGGYAWLIVTGFSVRLGSAEG